ncbi:MAG: DegT/DnrJ/EryC1/StrS family aminotransferase [Anaerolineaceae bacterium]
MNWKVPLADLDYGPEEEQAVLDVIKSKWLTMGAVTEKFEHDFRIFMHSKHAIAVANATEALHMACLVLGVGPGDEVIVPSLSFVATANAVLYTGANVVFADITSPQKPTISLRDIVKKATPKTKAIIVMHYAGYPCDMAEIYHFARTHNIFVIEDAAHAPGAITKGEYIGSYGDIGCFSFFSNKNIATGEGGMLTTQDDEIARRLRFLRSHGMTSLTYDRHQGHAYSYDVVALGYNYRIDEIHAALGIEQLKKLFNNNHKRGLANYLYRIGLATTVEVPFTKFKERSAFHLFPILLPVGANRQAFQEYMKEQGIQTSIHYPPIHLFSYYKNRYPIDHELPITEDYAAREVTLPLFPTITHEQIDYVCEHVKKGLSTAHYVISA